MKKILLAVATAVVLATAHAATPADDYTNFVVEKMVNFYKTGIDEKLYLATDKPYFSAGEQIWCKPIVANAITHAPLKISNYAYAEIVDNAQRLVQRVKIKRDSTGFAGYINLDPKLSPGRYTLRAYTRWMLNNDPRFIFAKEIEIVSPIPPSTETQPTTTKRRQQKPKSDNVEQQKFDLQFLPEGGTLLAGGSQIVAFKAIGTDGISVDVEGEIVDASGKVVSEFSSSNCGMGITTLYVNQGDSYSARARIVGEREYLPFDMPQVEAVGAVVSASTSAGRLLFKPRASSAELLDGAHFVVHSHGRVVSVTSVKGESTCSILLNQLFDGVNIISLLDKGGDILSERLIFKHPDQQPQISFETNKKSYKAREKVALAITADEPIPQGEYAISVTDNGVVERDPDDKNILSHILLESDIAGYVERPAQYFDTVDRKAAAYNIDLLMRTQGWRRYSLQKIINDSLDIRKYRYEEQTEIAGEVKGFFGNDARKPKIYILSNKPSFFDLFDLDESSRFRLLGLDMPDSAAYLVQARGRNGGGALTLKIDKDPFPKPRSTTFRRLAEQEPYIPVAFVNQSQDKFFYEGGMNMINLEAVTVSTTVEEAAGVNPFSTEATTRDELDMMGALDLLSLIQTYPSMTVSTEGVSYRGNTDYARFIVDGSYMELEDISYMTTADIEQIEFLDGPNAVEYSDAGSGIFVIKLRTGVTIGGEVTPPNIANVEKLGYQRAATFYQPNYAVESLRRNLPPDYRTTIYWDASIQPDKNGVINVEFFTADKPTDYTVTIEGLSADGVIYRATSIIERK